MKTSQIILSFFLLTLIAASCKFDTTPAPKDGGPKDRDMFGLGLKQRGLIKTSEGLTDGYAMFVEANSAKVYLVNRKGEVVKEWKSNYGVLGAYLNDDGSLTQNVDDPDFPVFAGGGESGRIQKISWDNKILWDFEYSNEDYCHHHDFTVMPNGHILAISWEAKTPEETWAAGRKPELTPKAGIWPDKIVEIVPDGERHGKVVWKWHAWDHLVQNVDPTKANYGNPADHPELIDINLGEMPKPITQDSFDTLAKVGKIHWRNQTLDNLGSDLYHFNAIKYNAALDQIVFSSPHLSEIFIIDHSTTTEEAKGHKGGRSGKGGDILWRWGNAHNYARADSTDQQLFGQHDVRWIEEGKPGAGHLTVFDNDGPKPIDHDKEGSDSLNYSAIFELVPPMDEKGNYVIEAGKPFGPEKPVWEYTAPDKLSFYSSFISGAHRMKNGNTFINEGTKGRIFEVTPTGETVWEYANPYRGEIRKLNGDPNSPMPMAYSLFRATFIPADHPGLAGHKLEPIDPQPTPFKLPPPPPEEEKKK
ncbi:MAG: aryl-sulfate sulfotransferase [Saprospiraceae bacterium]|nr:aryl-sulfate sulfotransferase [Saprospiraceae bacterium]MCF8251574.1 aryl-sulfate sulfotransferase [Saprospiraceae bacterium]MCF8282825.1 aryl-sulfate sulfotransferase [Bacteroidales bacterium]MCF8313469.1 aryl-sulfate sulfotransferase [Saprospiraceae bacterium]MCF8442210.1 aryl-sulfate sulfotransferase [Saprospiraceae bacterium]